MPKRRILAATTIAVVILGALLSGQLQAAPERPQVERPREVGSSPAATIRVPDFGGELPSLAPTPVPARPAPPPPVTSRPDPPPATDPPTGRPSIDPPHEPPTIDPPPETDPPSVDPPTDPPSVDPPTEPPSIHPRPVFED